jgi:hypothetical protein
MTELCVYTVRKRCYECGREWDGKAFTAQPTAAPRLPGVCSECIAKDGERVKELTARGPTQAGDALPELVRPRRPDDDEVDDWHARIAP